MTMRFPVEALWPSLFSAFMFLVLTGCGGSSDNATTPVAGSCDSSQKAVATASFAELYTNVFGPQCGACHGAGTNTGTAGGPNMKTADSFYAEVVGKKGTDYPDWDTYQKNREGCLTYDLINKGSAAQSVVTSILDSSVSLSGCTVKYHRDSPQSVCITAGNLSKLKEWMNAGASR